MKFLFSSILLRRMLVITSIYQCSFTCICPEPAAVYFKFVAKPVISAYEVMGVRNNQTFEVIRLKIDTVNATLTYPSIPLDLNADTTVMLIKTYQLNKWQQDTLVVQYSRQFHSSMGCGGTVGITDLKIKTSSFSNPILLQEQYGNSFTIQLTK